MMKRILMRRFVCMTIYGMHSKSLRGRRDQILVIVDAALSERKSWVTDYWGTKGWYVEHRVIGLRCDGMAELGFIYC